jgi:hypothetical protein
MRIIITESKIEKLGIEFLNKFFGQLHSREWISLPGYYNFQNKPGTDVYPIFEYDRRNGKDIVIMRNLKVLSALLEFFPFTKEQCFDLLTKWVREYYIPDFKVIDFGVYSKQR